MNIGLWVLFLPFFYLLEWLPHQVSYVLFYVLIGGWGLGLLYAVYILFRWPLERRGVALFLLLSGLVLAVSLLVTWNSDFGMLALPGTILLLLVYPFAFCVALKLKGRKTTFLPWFGLLVGAWCHGLYLTQFFYWLSNS